MLAIGPNIGWVYYSRYLETYLYYQMDEYVTKPKIEVWLFFISTLMTAIFTPIAAFMIGKMHIKAVICLGCISLMTGTLAFIVVNQTWTFVVVQGICGSVGTAIMFLSSL